MVCGIADGVLSTDAAGLRWIKRDILVALGRLSDRLPAMVIETLREQYARPGELDEAID